MLTIKAHSVRGSKAEKTMVLSRPAEDKFRVRWLAKGGYGKVRLDDAMDLTREQLDAHIEALVALRDAEVTPDAEVPAVTPETPTVEVPTADLEEVAAKLEN